MKLDADLHNMLLSRSDQRYKISFIFLMAVTMLLTGCQSYPKTDAVSSASLTYYETSSLNLEALIEAIQNQQGSCVIATVNSDGSPNLIVSVPGTDGGSHIIFGWADNTTKSNILRDKTAMIAYYIYDKSASEKASRHRGARIKAELEEDPATLLRIFTDNPQLPSTGTVMKIKEILPLG